jgi:hypothetical protein
MNVQDLIHPGKPEAGTASKRWLLSRLPNTRRAHRRLPRTVFIVSQKAHMIVGNDSIVNAFSAYREESRCPFFCSGSSNAGAKDPAAIGATGNQSKPGYFKRRPRKFYQS